MKNSNKAFTLIELLVVISIIGILTGLSIFGLQGAREASRDATRKAALEQIRSGLEIYKADCDSYPIGNSLSSPLKGTDSPVQILTLARFLLIRFRQPVHMRMYQTVLHTHSVRHWNKLRLL
jgi:prepilin-type N-terminal cleavage/methylation domain-containing protein